MCFTVRFKMALAEATPLGCIVHRCLESMRRVVERAEVHLAGAFRISNRIFALIICGLSLCNGLPKHLYMSRTD